MKQSNSADQSQPSITMDSETGAKSRQHRRNVRSSTFDQLVDACKRKDLHLIKSITSQRPELINRRDKFDRNLLHYTVILVSEELSKSTSVRSSTETLPTASNQIELDCLDCFAHLVERCDNRLWWQQDSDGLSILHLAVISSNVTMVRHIVHEHPYSIKYPLVCALDNEHHSPLHWAVIINNLECVKLLISYAGVKLAHEPDLNGASPLHYATQTGDYPKYQQQLRDMLKSVNESISISEGRTTASDAGEAGQPTAVKKVQPKPPISALSGDWTSTTSMDESNRRQIHSAGLEILEYLVRLPQVNLECADRDRRTPLLWAASSGCREAIVLLVSRGANINCYDLNRLGPLHCAASHGFTDCLECMLNLGGTSNIGGASRVNQSDNLNCTPLFYSVLSGNIDCVEILLERGADCDWQDAKGRTAAHFAALKGQLSTLKMLHERGANLWLPNKRGDLPLHYAIKSGRQQVVRWLLENSPYDRAVNAINNFGQAPIHLAVLKDNIDMASYLIGCGANLNQLVKVRDKPPSQRLVSDQQTQIGAKPPATEKEAPAHRYETAVDMASRLGRHECLKLLIAHNAIPAARVMSDRASGGQRVVGNATSLFDLQSVHGPSPIGFDTSSSSASVSQAQQSRQPTQQQSMPSRALPKLTRPAPDTLPTTDSTNSSALSQNSLTSVRGARDQSQPRNHQDSRRKSDQRQQPYRGGISYNNELIDASIKCRVYNRAEENQRPNLHSHRSFPETSSPSADHQLNQRVRILAQGSRCSKSAEANGGAGYLGGSQEIVTNVNVYTSPCAHCAHNQLSDTCVQCASPLATGGQLKHRQLPKDARVEQVSEDDFDQTSEMTAESDPTEQHHYNLPNIEGRRPQALKDSQAQRHSYLLPSHGHEQHLPVILSEQERSTSTTSEGQSPMSAYEGADHPETLYTSGDIRSTQKPSTASEEPRFDRAPRSNSTRRADRYRDHVRSPVAEYIRSPVGHSYAALPPTSRPTPLPRGQQPPRVIDYSRVRPKVDSHWTQDDPLQCEAGAYRSRSLHNMQHAVTSAADSGVHSSTAGDQQHRGQYIGAHEDTSVGRNSRSVSRQTVTRTRRLSVDSVELAIAVERSIRKYKQETKLFEELQNLKRSQIRSGRANEALLVKRLIEHFSNEVAPLDLLEPYHGPYTYKSYERFLYDQLRKLSQSNQTKLSKIPISDQMDAQQRHSQLQQHRLYRDYEDEDSRAEMELRRVLASDSDPASLVLEPSGALDEIQVKGKSDGNEREPQAGNTSKDSETHDTEPAAEPQQVPERHELQRETIERQATIDDQNVDTERDEQTLGGSKLDDEKGMVEVRRASISSFGSSRRSSVEMEREKVLNLPLRVESGGDDTKNQLLADSMSSSILVDALGNVSRASSAKSRGAKTGEDDSQLDDGDLTLEEAKDDAQQAAEATSGDQPPPEVPYYANRRRSVVNIGDKMEIVYHDVGIEIDKAPDHEPESEQHEADTGITRDLPLQRKFSRVSEGDEDEIEASDVAGLSQNDEFGSPTDSFGPPAKQLRERRVSSPPSYALTRGDGSDTKSMKGTTMKKRSQSVGRHQFEQQVGAAPLTEIRRVFDGYDLDEMRGRKRASEDATSETDKTQVSKQMSDEGEEIARVFEKNVGDKIEDSSSRQSSFGDRATDEGFVSRNTIHKSSQRVTPLEDVVTGDRESAASSSRKQAPRFERSHLPKEKYVIFIPFEEIRARWSRIKRREMARKREFDACGSEQQVFWVNSGEPTQSRGEAEATSGAIGRRQSLSAKSQPNIQSTSRRDSESLKLHAEVPNYILLYEINKGKQLEQSSGDESQGNQSVSKGKGSGVWPTVWCRRRAIKIVDVRSLKRTLSVPESLIYSNDLFKRFNILKL